ncbi:hypothetical protein B9N43_11810 [Denitratisoma sp. DHT3]|uniref:beta strand repeat-containing protein n=1 Tax=Denitratisoma sp. DHT3 TaxID=1981880 RepID=UPI001198CBC6|nr:calcium-binding protein [Denitratisoma sp. DHT3]QDX81877.1 hypothetical protein B9N43_11810 [Denitratisoma sp. DHT3]
MLTADIDSGTAFTGGSGNDTFIADETTTAKVSLADVLAGGLGTDSLTIYNSKGVAPQMSAIESVTLNTIAGDYNASTATGLTTLNVISADGTNTFTVGSGVSVSLANTAIANTAGTKDDVVVVYDANATSATLTLNNVSSGGTNSDLAIKGAKIATLNIATTGAASTIDALLTATDTVVDSYVITGDKGLTITDALTLATNATTKANAITSTGLTGDLSYSLGTIAANQNVTIAAGNGVNTVTIADVNVDGSVTATFGSGKDVITLSDATGSVSINTGDGADKVTISKLDNKYNSTDKETASVNLGAGDDTLVVASTVTEANLASGVTLAGGDGIDTLNIDNDEYLKLFDNATADVTVTGFEKLALQNGDSGTFDLSKVSSGTMTTVVLADGVNTGGGLVVSNGAAGLTIDWADKDGSGVTAGGAVDVSLKDASGSADAVTLNVTLTDSDDTVDSLVIGDFEVKADSNSKTVETLNIAVDGALSATTASNVKTAASQYLQITSLDLSGGVTTVNISGDGSTKINGYANASTLVTVNAANSSGANNLSVAAGTTFIGGTGNDTFTGTQAQFAAITSLTGGTGTDTVAITDTVLTTATLTIDDKAFKNVAAAEAISFTGANAGDFSWTLGGYANTFATNNSGVITATATALVAAADGDTITVDASGLSGTNAISLTLTDTAAQAGKTNDITITGSAGGDTLKITEAKAGAGGDVSVDGGAGNDTITVTVTATHAGTVAIAGGAGDDTITGSAIGDTITGGAGADKITGGEGGDSITGGTGADQIILTEAVAAQDTVVIAAGDSNVDARDTVTGFAAIAGGTADKLDLVGAATIQADGVTDGSNFNTIKSHTVASGVITFDDAETFAAAVTVNSSNLSDVLGYLAANITGAGATVGFAYDSNSDGTNDATLIFQNNAGGDILVELVGVTGITAVAGAAGANTVLVG